MKIVWHFDTDDVAKVRAFFEQHQNDPFVQYRIRRNLSQEKPPPTNAAIWETMVGCLLTTQQRSGPGSPVSKFLTRPFSLSLEKCANQSDLAEFVRKTLSGFGGLRRSNVIADQVAANWIYVENGGWQLLVNEVEAVQVEGTQAAERHAADFIDEHLKGFGPKQSRNLLQWLGVSRFEIPIDSRVTAWLNKFGFPVTLTANALQDRSYYNFVSEGFQKLCEACEIVPCVLDAAIFSSYDGGRWTEENVVW